MTKKKIKKEEPIIEVATILPKSDDFILIADFFHKISNINSLIEKPVFDKERNCWAISFAVDALFHTTYFKTEQQAIDQLNAIKVKLHKPLTTVSIIANEDLDLLRVMVFQKVLDSLELGRRVISVDIKNIMNEYVATLLLERI